MNANWYPASGVHQLRRAANLHKASAFPARIAVFGSFMGGYHVLSELLLGELADPIKVVGVATDDPTQPFTNSKVRLWKYPHTDADETLVPSFARSHRLPVFTGRVKSPEFLDLVAHEWRPDIILMATFGQKIPSSLIEIPRFGFFNFHHAGPMWPSYPGPDP